jgi:iron complex outermembrane recepter protein
VQIIKRDDIEKSGVTTAAELLTKISANAAALTDGAHFSDIAGQRGFSGANLRGIGVSSTLVLLNGRRLANFASPGGASGVDLNSIPSAAIERVEILKDGASAIYGTDAISGVINFITRAEYQGVDLYAYASNTQDGGAEKRIFTASGGFGDIGKDKYNVFGVFDWQDTKALRTTQRNWVKGSYQPDINLDVGSSNTFPANFRRLNASNNPTGSRFNPSVPACNPPANLFLPDSFVGNRACFYDYMQDTEMFPASERKSVLLRGQFAASPNVTFFGEALYAQTDTLYRISPLTITNLNYRADGRYYPTATATAAGTTGPLRLNYRLTEAGGRTNEVSSEVTRFLFGAKGSLGQWDFDAAINFSENQVSDAYVDGYVGTTAFDTAFATGNINPFGPSDAAGLALLNSTKIKDDARKSRGTTQAADLKLSRPLFAMGGGDAAIAFGLEGRREDMDFTPSALLAAGQIRGNGTATSFSGKRNVAAVFAEVSLPLSKTLEVQAALRFDDYSDAGNTTNPKLGIRWNPVKDVLVRGSYGTGFRAPSLADLYTPTRIGQTNGVYNDPLGCRVVGNIDNTRNPDYCGLQPDKLRGGSTNLKPEESKQASLGVVFEGFRNFSTSVDFWHIEKTETIVSPEGIYFSDPARFAQFITRAAADPALPGIPGRITQIDSRLRNLGGLKTNGVDIGVEWRAPTTSLGKFTVNFNGTYVMSYKLQDGPGSPYVEAVGRFYLDQVVQRWRHTLGFNLERGAWNATLQQTFYNGHTDQQRLADGSSRRVDAYELWDFSASWQYSKPLKFRVGVKNLFDEEPPRSNQLYSFLAGYDPNYTDPRGRQYYASVSWSFR